MSATSSPDSCVVGALHVPQHRGLQPAEAEIQIALQLGRIAIGVRQPRRRQRNRAIVAGLRQPIDDRTAGIPEPQQLGDLVVRFSRRIVARPAEQLVMPGPIDEIQARMPARHDQHDRRQRHLAVVQHERFDVAGEMMNADQRKIRGRRRRLRKRQADEQRTDQARAVGDRNGSEVAPGRRRVVQRALDDAADVANVLA